MRQLRVEEEMRRLQEQVKQQQRNGGCCGRFMRLWVEAAWS